MKLIPLTRGLCAQVDDCDFEELNRFKWSAAHDGNTFYAIRTGPRPNRGTIRMHRQIMAGREIDHRDGNGLNNQRFNLRNGTHQQNLQNSDRKHRGKSPFKGVTPTRLKSSLSYMVHIRIDKKKTYLGIFKNPIIAAMVYDRAAKQQFGEFARTNF